MRQTTYRGTPLNDRCLMAVINHCTSCSHARIPITPWVIARGSINLDRQFLLLLIISLGLV